MYHKCMMESLKEEIRHWHWLGDDRIVVLLEVFGFDVIIEFL